MKLLNNLIRITKYFLILILAKEAYAMQPTVYVIGFKSYDSICMTSVNGVRALANYERKGPVMGGIIMSAYLENGTNTVSLDMATLSILEGNSTYQPDAYCELMVSERIIEDTSEKRLELFKLIGSVDGDLKPTGMKSPNYQENKITEHPVDGTVFYRINKSFNVSGLPEWAWTKATKFEATDENIEKLRQAYLRVWQTINTKNIEEFKALSYISFNENEIAANYPGSWYDSLDFEQNFKDSIGAMPINWDDYELVILNNGRLVKLEDDEGFSPLGFKDADGELITSYNPYFSLIDGNMVLTR